MIEAHCQNDYKRDLWRWNHTIYLSNKHTRKPNNFSMYFLTATLVTKYLSTYSTMMSSAKSIEFITTFVTFLAVLIRHPILLKIILKVSCRLQRRKNIIVEFVGRIYLHIIFNSYLIIQSLLNFSKYNSSIGKSGVLYWH